jgi:hypothetical protein
MTEIDALGGSASTLGQGRTLSAEVEKERLEKLAAQQGNVGPTFLTY